MLKINCNDCANLCDRATGCKLYGADPAAAAKACRADLFINYSPRKEEGPKFTPGAEVWVVERTGGGTACDVSGYVFLAEVAHAVIATPYIDDLEDLEELLNYHIEETADNYDTDLVVLPAADCYTDKDAAHAALRAEKGEG